MLATAVLFFFFLFGTGKGPWRRSVSFQVIYFVDSIFFSPFPFSLLFFFLYPCLLTRASLGGGLELHGFLLWLSCILSTYSGAVLIVLVVFVAISSPRERRHSQLSLRGIPSPAC